jgi:hypothetical protein
VIHGLYNVNQETKYFYLTERNSLTLQKSVKLQISYFVLLTTRSWLLEVLKGTPNTENAFGHILHYVWEKHVPTRTHAHIYVYTRTRVFVCMNRVNEANILQSFKLPSFHWVLITSSFYLSRPKMIYLRPVHQIPQYGHPIELWYMCLYLQATVYKVWLFLI